MCTKWQGATLTLIYGFQNHLYSQAFIFLACQQVFGCNPVVALGSDDQMRYGLGCFLYQLWLDMSKI